MKFFVACCLLFILFSCGDDTYSKKDEKKTENAVATNTSVVQEKAQIIEPKQDTQIVVLAKNGIKLTEIKTKNYPNASLKLLNTSFKAGKNVLNFKISGIADTNIAFIANNFGISHHQKTKITKEFIYGNNVFVAFLTNNKGISIKANKAKVLKNILIDDESLFNMSQPHLFYYLPQASVQQAILDFYLVNTAIAKKGNKVKATINGTIFLIDKWAAYQITGLKKKNNTIRIQLIDKNGKLIQGAFNDSGDRSFALNRQNIKPMS